MVAETRWARGAIECGRVGAVRVSSELVYFEIK